MPPKTMKAKNQERRRQKKEEKREKKPEDDIKKEVDSKTIPRDSTEIAPLDVDLLDPNVKAHEDVDPLDPTEKQQEDVTTTLQIQKFAPKEVEQTPSRNAVVEIMKKLGAKWELKAEDYLISPGCCSIGQNFIDCFLTEKVLWAINYRITVSLKGVRTPPSTSNMRKEVIFDDSEVYDGCPRSIDELIDYEDMKKTLEGIRQQNWDKFQVQYDTLAFHNSVPFKVIWHEFHARLAGKPIPYLDSLQQIMFMDNKCCRFAPEGVDGVQSTDEQDGAEETKLMDVALIILKKNPEDDK